jgi:hypothetical protein
MRAPLSRGLSLRAALVTLAIGAVALVPSTASATVGSYKFNGSTASASFSKVDGCVYTDAYVFANDDEVKNNQTGRTSTSSVWLFVSRYDSCTNTYHSGSGYTELGQDDFEISPSLRSASLNTSVEVYEYGSGQTVPVSVALKWIADGDSSKDKIRYQTRYPDGSKVMYQSSGLFRQAVASGTISDGTVDYTAGEQSDWAGLSSTKSGSLTITK